MAPPLPVQSTHHLLEPTIAEVVACVPDVPDHGEVVATFGDFAETVQEVALLDDHMTLYEVDGEVEVALCEMLALGPTCNIADYVPVPPAPVAVQE